MSTPTQESRDNRGTYSVYHVTSGVVYQGWYLVASATPTPDGRTRIETQYIPLDFSPGAPTPATPEPMVVTTDKALSALLLDAQVKEQVRHLHARLDEWARRHREFDAKPPACVQIETADLGRLALQTLLMAEDHPHRPVLVERLRQVRAQTISPALHRDLALISLDGVIPIERDER